MQGILDLLCKVMKLVFYVGPLSWRLLVMSELVFKLKMDHLACMFLVGIQWIPQIHL